MSYALGASYCRVLSGQRRPGMSVEDGIQFTTDCIETCLEYAQQLGITLVLENHYKDDFWEYPEFAQYSDVFCRLLANINHPNFGVNFDPSNALLANEDPVLLLRLIADRVLTMHASDRYILEGSLNDLHLEESGKTGYANRLRHGEIGMGLNDYDTIFYELRKVNFTGWISIEDGVDGMDQLERSVRFLRRKIASHWPAES
jgi:sugar phosphate isomerase/epimerase